MIDEKGGDAESGSSTEPERRGCRSAGTLISAMVAAAFVFLWMVGGPGPKYEEHFGAILMAFAVGFCGLVAGVLDPRPLLGPILFTAMWLVGYLVMWIGIALEYGYSFWQADPFLFALKPAFALLVCVAIVNLISLAIRFPFRPSSP